MSEAEHEPVCNMCGLSCTTQHSRDNGMPPLGLIGCEARGGYDSTPGNGCGALDDMTTYAFSLCEFCLDRLFSRFKRPPRVLCHIDEEAEAFRPAERRVWEDGFFEEQARRDAARDA